MSFKRLSSPSGLIVDSGEKRQTDVPVQIVRKAIFVHSGAEGAPMVFQSGDGEISFDEARIQEVVNNQNKKIQDLASQYGGLDKMPIGARDPLLDQHNNDSNDRIRGRVTGLMTFEKRDVPGVGKNVACVVGEITFLGKETVERVLDGRIYHLSVGISETTNTLGELSTVIEPAAPGAMLLSGKKGKSTNMKKGSVSMSAKLKRLMRQKERLTKLAAINEELTKMGAKVTDTKKMIGETRVKTEESQRVNSVSHRLGKLVAAFKMTPAEFKSMDVKKLAKASDEVLDTMFAGYDTRPVIEDKRQFGATDAVEFAADLGKNLEKTQMKRLKSEVKSDFRKLGKKLAKDEADEKDGDTYEMAGGNKISPVSPGTSPGAVPGQAACEEQLSKHMSEMKSHLEKGDVEKAKLSYGALEKHMSEKKLSGEGYAPGDMKSEDQKKSLDTLQGQIDEMHTNMARLAGMVSELMGAEKAEGDDMEKKMTTTDKPGKEGEDGDEGENE